MKNIVPLTYVRTTVKDPQNFEPITLDWIQEEKHFTENTPTVIVLPGVTGSSDAPYVRSVVKHIQHKYRVVVYSRPGCGSADKVQITTPKFFFNCHPLTIKALIESVNDKLQGKSPLYVIGFSMGGQNIIRTAGEYDLPMIKGIITCNQPYNTPKMVKHVHENQRLYDRALTNFIRGVFVANKHIYSPIMTEEQIEKVSKVNSLRDLDEAWTKPVHGFKDIDKEFYAHRSITDDHLMNIKVPTVMLQAMDDAVLAPAELAKYVFDIASERNEHLICVRTNHGSHCSYETMGPYYILPAQTSFMDKVCMQVLDAYVAINNA
jgi:predicted alpha/beta-fold hydrolase